MQQVPCTVGARQRWALKLVTIVRLFLRFISSNSTLNKMELNGDKTPDLNIVVM
jgi:hypothetical protein